ncbi:MAG: ribonuclease HI [Deferribacteres bacterium]|nr:ribonuclease HI [candidate division KSB1 bacterium]MCB9502261.1 ribonuclease HI [Deferribacteres bacterium]
MPKRLVKIYTDGACSGNPGPGGWGVLLQFGEHSKELAGYEANTTNNRMEIQAVIEGLQALKESCTVKLYSDSAYVVNTFKQGWLINWKRNGWKRGPRKNEQVQNEDLWRILDNLVQNHEVEFIKVQGHAGHEFNERVDRLAVEQIEKNR